MIYSRKQVKHLKKIHKYKNQCIVKLLNIFKDRFPVINNLIQKINLRKRRDTIILASVIATCTILLMLYAFHWRVPVISVWESVSCGTVVSEWDRESLIGMFRRCWWSMKLWWVINHWPSCHFHVYSSYWFWLLFCLNSGTVYSILSILAVIWGLFSNYSESVLKSVFTGTSTFFFMLVKLGELTSTSFGFLLAHITSTLFIVLYWQHSSCEIGVHFLWLHCINVLHYIGTHFKRNIYYYYIWQIE